MLEGNRAVRQLVHVHEYSLVSEIKFPCAVVIGSPSSLQHCYLLGTLNSLATCVGGVGGTEGISYVLLFLPFFISIKTLVNSLRPSDTYMRR